jgi:hypothetical protein
VALRRDGVCGDRVKLVSEVEGTRTGRGDVCRGSFQRHSFRRLDENRRPVGPHFGDSLHHLARIVAGSDNGVRAQFGGPPVLVVILRRALFARRRI